VERLVELAEPQYGQMVLVGAATGERMRVTLRFLVNHPDCRASTRSAGRAADRGRQPATAGDLTDQQREIVRLRIAHLLEVETGYRSGDPLRPAQGESRWCFDPASTTLTQRRRAKVAELAALGRDEARLLSLDRVGYRTLIRWEVRRRRFGAVGCADDRWLQIDHANVSTT
jgi:hypothetical protein